MGTEGSTMLEPVWRGLPPIDAPGVSGSASCSLPTRFEAVQGARRFTGATLEQWNLPEMFDEVALVVSELVTNALRHGVSDLRPDGSPRAETETQVRLHLMRWHSRLVCAVRDPSGKSPVAGEADAGQESGRGLFLVESFTDDWGWHPLAGTLRGKVVWALFLLPRPR